MSCVFPIGDVVALQGLGRSERRWRPPLQVLLYNSEAMILGLKGADDLEPSSFQCSTFPNLNFGTVS
jgi:hypothetical protein